MHRHAAARGAAIIHIVIRVVSVARRPDPEHMMLVSLLLLLAASCSAQDKGLEGGLWMEARDKPTPGNQYDTSSLRLLHVVSGATRRPSTCVLTVTL